MPPPPCCWDHLWVREWKTEAPKASHSVEEDSEPRIPIEPGNTACMVWIAPTRTQTWHFPRLEECIPALVKVRVKSRESSTSVAEAPWNGSFQVPDDHSFNLRMFYLNFNFYKLVWFTLPKHTISGSFPRFGNRWSPGQMCVYDLTSRTPMSQHHGSSKTFPS